jgi:hypothetical protein
MIAATFIATFFVPMFYIMIQRISIKAAEKKLVQGSKNDKA